VEIENFDANPVWGIVNSADCEDMSNLGSTVLRQLPAAAAVGGAETPLLAAAARVCATRIVLDVAASVTGAYVNTEGKELGREELKAVTDLPRIGDAMDARAHVGGHCHGIWEGMAVAAARLGNAGIDVAKELPALHAYAQNASAWEKVQPSLVLEGTSSIEAWVLPAGEVVRATAAPDAAAFEARATTRRAFIKHARTAAPTLFEHFKLEGLSFYTAQRPAGDADRRDSSFYRGVAHLVSPELYAMNPLFGQLTAVEMRTHTRGVEIGAYLRSAMDRSNTNVALVPTFAGIGRAQWDAVVRPVMAVVQNQMPLNAFARFASPAAFEAAALRNDHVLSPAALATPGNTLTLAATPAAPTDTPTAALCIYTFPWRIAEAGVEAAVHRELAALTASGHLASYALVHDKPLAASDDVLTLQLTLRVPGVAAPLKNALPTMRTSLFDVGTPVWLMGRAPADSILV
jgi:hypothetical protein